MNDANGGAGSLKGHISDVLLKCGSVETFANLYVGDGVPFDLLIGRPWQRDNLVSIDEHTGGTYLVFKDPQNIEITYELLVEDHAPWPDYRFDAYKPPKIEEFNVGMATMSLAEMIGPEDVGPIPELGSIDLDNSQELPRGCNVTHHGFSQPDILAMFHAKNTLTYLRGKVRRQKKVYMEEARRYIQDTAS